MLFQGGNNQRNLAAVCIAHKNMMMLVVIMSLAVFACKGLVQALPFPAPNFNNCNNYQGCCPAPYNGTISEKLNVFDRKLPMRTRPAAHLLDDAYIAKYQRAYRLLKAIPDSDLRSWKNRAKLHCAYCNAAFNFDVLKSSGRSSTMRFTMGGCFSHGIDSSSTFTSAYWQSFWATTTHLLYPFGIGIINHRIHHLRM